MKGQESAPSQNMVAGRRAPDLPSCFQKRRFSPVRIFFVRLSPTHCMVLQAPRASGVEGPLFC